MQKQHVAFYRKLLLRHHLLRRFAVPGAVYVPFIGDGDLAIDCYKDRQIFGADIDPQRVNVARNRLNGEIIVADCDPWPFPGTRATFAVADFDAYVYPYESFRSFWAEAPKNSEMILFFTDTVKQDIKRNGRVVTPDGVLLPYLPEVVAGSRERSEFYNKWFSLHVWPWFEEYIRPYRVLDKVRYLRQDTVYWGTAIRLD